MPTQNRVIINLSENDISTIRTIYGEPPINDAAAMYGYLEDNTVAYDYRNNYVLYQNSIGLKSLVEANAKSYKVLNYIDQLLTSLTSKPDFWNKLTEGIRNQPSFTFDPKIVTNVTKIRYTDGQALVAQLVTKETEKQDYRVFAIDSLNSFTNKPTFNNKTVDNNITKGVSSINEFRSGIVGYIDPDIFGGSGSSAGYSKWVWYKEEKTVDAGNLVDDNLTDDSAEFKELRKDLAKIGIFSPEAVRRYVEQNGTTQIRITKLKNKQLFPDKNTFMRLYKNNGYVFQPDLKLILTPSFTAKTFTGGLYEDVKNIGYTPLAKFSYNRL